MKTFFTDLIVAAILAIIAIYGNDIVITTAKYILIILFSIVLAAILAYPEAMREGWLEKKRKPFRLFVYLLFNYIVLASFAFYISSAVLLTIFTATYFLIFLNLKRYASKL